MIILDTNVISELSRQLPDENLLQWLNSLPNRNVATTAVTAAELFYGVRRLPDGHRKQQLADAIEALLNDDLLGRVEPFTLRAAIEYATVVTRRERLGRPIGMADAQIAAICLTRNATLATRNTKDFEETGVELFNPWTYR